MRNLFLILASLAALLATPAAAADLAQIGCVEQSMTPDIRKAIADDTDRMMATTEPGFAYSQASIAGLQGAMKSCLERFGWSVDAAQAAGRYTIAKLSLPVARAWLEKAGVNAAGILALYEKIPVDKRATMNDDEAWEAVGSASIDAGFLNGRDAAGQLGRFCAFLIMFDRDRAVFARS
jgi:hypothetical protein